MEISLVSPHSIRIKNRQGSLLINPGGKSIVANGIIIMKNASFDLKSLEEGTVVIQGAGEYEFAGIKISGFRNGEDILYSIRTDRIEILFGSIKTLEKDYAKLKEHHIVIAFADSEADPSFLTSVASNVIIFVGEKAEGTISKIAKDGYRKESKYSITFEKLPQEIEEILLTS